MFGIGLPELILIMAVALIVVGPEKLPELAKGLAKQLIELKKAANVLKDSLNEDDREQSDRNDSDLPIGFSRPEQLAEAGRKASAINQTDGNDGEESTSDPYSDGSPVGLDETGDKSPEESAAPDINDPAESADVEEKE